MRALLDKGVLIGEDARSGGADEQLPGPGREMDYTLTSLGETFLRDFGVDVDDLRRHPRLLIRYCIDWSERRPHLGGALGAALAQHLFDLGWLRRRPDSRATTITERGSLGLRATFGIVAEDLIPAPA